MEMFFCLIETDLKLRYVCSKCIDVIHIEMSTCYQQMCYPMNILRVIFERLILFDSFRIV